MGSLVRENLFLSHPQSRLIPGGIFRCSLFLAYSTATTTDSSFLYPCHLPTLHRVYTTSGKIVGTCDKWQLYLHTPHYNVSIKHNPRGESTYKMRISSKSSKVTTYFYRNTFSLSLSLFLFPCGILFRKSNKCACWLLWCCF